MTHFQRCQYNGVHCFACDIAAHPVQVLFFF